MIKVIGTGSYLPKKVLTNDELSKTVDTTHAWIKQRTGISERRIASSKEASFLIKLLPYSNTCAAILPAFFSFSISFCSIE